MAAQRARALRRTTVMQCPDLSQNPAYSFFDARDKLEFANTPKAQSKPCRRDMRSTSAFYMAEYKASELIRKQSKVRTESKQQQDLILDSRLFSIILPPNWERRKNSIMSLKLHQNSGQKSGNTKQDNTPILAAKNMNKRLDEFQKELDKVYQQGFMKVLKKENPHVPAKFFLDKNKQLEANSAQQRPVGNKKERAEDLKTADARAPVVSKSVLHDSAIQTGSQLTHYTVPHPREVAAKPNTDPTQNGITKTKMRSRQTRIQSVNLGITS